MDNFLYKIGDNIKTNTKDIVIIDRKYDKETNAKMYKIRCNICGFDSGEHYLKGVKHNEYWVKEYNLTHNKYCPCCNNVVISKEINSISVIAPWMAEYFDDINNSFKYSICSNEKINMHCVLCNADLGLHQINNLHKHKKLSCVCNDSISFPNKISYYLFQ